MLAIQQHWRPEVRSVWNRIDDVAAVVLLQLPLMQRLFVPAAMPLHNISSAHQYISFLKAAKEVLMNRISNWCSTLEPSPLAILL